MGNFSGIGTGLVLIGIFLVWFVYHFWWIILGITGIVIGGYYLINYFNKKEEKRLEQERRERAIRQAKIREENKIKEEKRLEQERIRKAHEKEQKRIREENNRIQSRLELFSFTEAESEILFGKLWKKRLAKPEDKFMEQEVSRIIDKITDEDVGRFFRKIHDFAEKVLDMLDYYVQVLGKQRGWDEIEYDNWKERWDNVRRIWADTKDHYRAKSKKIRDSDNYYEILGIPREYTIKEIKVHYRKLMLKFHPDRNNSADSEEKCKKINQAYEILSDPAKKKSYDQYGFIFE
jgi:hypothetical protein